MLSRKLKAISKGQFPTQSANRSRRGKLALLIAGVLPCAALATPVEVNTTVTLLQAQATYGGGDVLVRVAATGIAGCDYGF
jgi:hypothetical protein